MIGQIILWGGDFAPAGWMICNGDILPAAAYPDLYAAVGRNYTFVTDDIDDFRLPDLRGRVPMGSGQGDGLSTRTVGDKMGVEFYQLQLTEIPPHTHPIARGTSGAPNVPQVSFSTGNNSAPFTTGSAGGVPVPTPQAQPHNNMQPSLVMNYIIYAGVQ